MSVFLKNQAAAKPPARAVPAAMALTLSHLGSGSRSFFENGSEDEEPEGLVICRLHGALSV